MNEYVREDSVFGTVEYDEFGWSRELELDFCGELSRITLKIDGDDEFEEGQRKAYSSFMEKWGSLQKDVLKSILVYYQEKREELGYDVEENEDYPEILTEKQLLEHIEFTGINVAYEGIFGGRSIGLSFSCDWNEEDGLGVRMSDEQVEEVGYQGIVL